MCKDIRRFHMTVQSIPPVSPKIPFKSHLAISQLFAISLAHAMRGLYRTHSMEAGQTFVLQSLRAVIIGRHLLRLHWTLWR